MDVFVGSLALFDCWPLLLSPFAVAVAVSLPAAAFYWAVCAFYNWLSMRVSSTQTQDVSLN